MADNENDTNPETIAALAEGVEWPESMERPRGIFTDTDRQFLWGVKSYDSAPTTSERRGKIRERAINGIQDLRYLRKLDDPQRKRVIDTLEEDTTSRALDKAVEGLIAFVYRGLGKDKSRIEEMVSHGIYNGESEPGNTGPYSGGVKEVSVDIDIDRDYDAEEIYRRYKEGEGNQLTPAEIGALVREGMIDDTDIWHLSYGEGGTPDEEALNDPNKPTPPMWPDSDDTVDANGED